MLGAILLPGEYEEVEHLYPYKPDFSINEVLELLQQKPKLSLINAQRNFRTWYMEFLDQLKTINPKSLKR